MFALHIDHGTYDETRLFDSAFARALCAISLSPRVVALRFEDL